MFNNKFRYETINSQCKIEKSKTVVKLTFPVQLTSFLSNCSHKDCATLFYKILNRRKLRRNHSVFVKILKIVHRRGISTLL